MLGTLILLAIAFPVAAIVGLAMALGTRDRLGRLQFRVEELEKRLAGLASGSAPSPMPRSPSIAPIPELDTPPEPTRTWEPAQPTKAAPEPDMAGPMAATPPEPPPPPAGPA